MSDFEDMAARAYQIDDAYAQLEEAKHGSPWNLTERVLGLTGDVADLGRLVMRYQGRRGEMTPEELNDAIDHELGDIQLVLHWIARATGRNLKEAFYNTTNELEARIAKEMPKNE